MPFEAPDSQIMTASNAEATGSFASMEDPFIANSGRPAASRDSHRNSSFDTQLYSLNASSPAQAKRALEAHLVETERRLEEASRLGTALIDQQRQLSEQLKEVEQQQNEGEIGPDLRRKLADLEKEYNEIGRESARAFLAPKRLAGGADDAQLGTPSFDQKSPLSSALFASQATNSPSKVSVPSRKQRNQPSNRVHDIEFATEISTSLLAQVRQLQALLAERDETLKFVNLEKSRLELEAEGYGQRIRALDDSEQRYKDENWALETQAHELMAAARDAAEREQRLNSTITLSNAEKNAVEREVEELRQANARLLEDQSLTQKANDAEIHLLRRNLTSGEAEKSALQKKLMEMTSQNQELAKAVAMRLREHENQSSRDVSYDDEGDEPEHITPESSPPQSPNKFTPRHGHLESETLKSSLGHAHRMIQNLKSTIHREKTEKIELKRMLQDARDEVEQRRRDSTVPNGASKRQKTKPDASRKPPRPDLLGAGRKEKSFVELHDTDWEDNAGQVSPTQTHTKTVSTRDRPRSESPDGPSDVYQTATEAEDGFETANERATATESEAFQTGVESMADDSSDSAELTETEHHVQTTPRSQVPSSLIMAKARDRSSYHSTASASSDEEEYDGAFGSPSQMHISRPRLRSKRSISRRIRPSGEATFASTSRPSSPRASVAPSFAPAPAAQEGQSLFAELGDFDSNEDDEVTSQASTPRMEPASDSRRPSDAMLDAPPKPAMVDSGVMTEPWEHTSSISAGIVAGAASIAATQPSQTADREIVEETKETPHVVKPEMGIADVSSQETTPSAPQRPDLSISYITGGITTPVKHQLPVPEVPEMTISSISSQTTSPIQPTVVVPEPIIKHVDVIKYVEREPEVPELTFSSITTQSTSPVHATLAVPEPIIKYVDVIKHVEREPEVAELTLSSITTQTTEPVKAIVPEPLPPVIQYVDVIKHVEREREVPKLSFSSVAAQSTIPVQAIQATVPEPEPVIKYVDVIKLVERERENPELTCSSINNQSTVPVQATLAVPEPIIKYVDVIKHVEREPEVPELTFSPITSQTTEPVKATVPEPLPPVIQYVDVIKHIEREREVPDSSFSSIATQSTAPIDATLAQAKPIIEYVDVIKHVEREREVPDLTFSSISNQSTAPVHATLAVHEPVIQYVDVIKHVEREREMPELTFSSITTQSTAPVKATVPEPEPPVIQYVDIIKHVEREREAPVLTISSLDPAYTEPIIPRPRLAPTPALSFSSVRSVETHPVKYMPVVLPGVADFSTQTESTESNATEAAVIIHEDQPTGAARSRTSTANSDKLVGAGLALNDISGNALARSARQQSSSVSMDQGSQTILSSKQIDQILMDRVSARPLSSDSQVTDNSREIAAAPYVTPKAPTRPRLSQIQSAKSTTPTHRRPTSAASQTSGASHPPLPFDHREAIMAAEKRSIDIAPPSPTSVMGPPLAPASAYRMNSQRPLTPSEQAARASSSRTGSSQARMRRGSQSQMSRRSSVSSFASEIEERFNTAPHAGAMPQGYGPNTDPRMIQAITQTMIGEFLWKYTRKTGSSDMSTTRHRRYFWVHPYTRTLYWSTQDPQTAGKSELRTKSVPIEAVRVVADDNPYPPGLHCRSLEVVSPGRRVRFTATTSQRHETWFNALSYLLLRETNENCEDNNSVTLDDINEFNPPSFRSSSRQTARMSFSSYNSRTARNAHKQQRRAASAMSMRSSGTLGGRASPALSSPVPNPNSSLQVPDDRQRSSSRLSTISSSIRGSIASLKGRPGQSPSIHNESLHGQESADDLRQVVEAQEQDRLENVRACCDGKHDVGSLSRTSRYSPRINRIHSPHRH
ncbi:hypothetical protein PENCOP_c006G06876 [Penicillium coprophilum]|uniref:PH domain-containing protein n=1 Tax=Penicillium coprophilum TaxID=36646 RepID=A0A1V6UPC2_9EURO|nr:hypothetical protein PENCOP_c006G06876 [Penicillium coprophilum]